MEKDEKDTEHRQLIADLSITDRIRSLKEATTSEERFMSVEQARLITETYRAHPDAPRVIQRARALAAALTRMPLRMYPGELIVGNRTPGIRAGVVSTPASSRVFSSSASRSSFTSAVNWISPAGTMSVG